MILLWYMCWDQLEIYSFTALKESGEWKFSQWVQLEKIVCPCPPYLEAKVA